MMSFPNNRRGCFVCGKPGHIAAACTSTERLCFNCSEPGHESNACPNPKVADNKQCYSCGGMGHLVAECPSIRVGSVFSSSPASRFPTVNATLPTGSLTWLASQRPHSAFNAAGPKCYNCQQFGHIARSCPNATIAPVDGQTVAPVAPVVAPAVAPVAPFPRVPLGARIGGYAPRGGFMGARGGFMGAAAARG